MRLSDTDFVTACDLPDDPIAAHVALAVRRDVANVGLVDSQFIRPEDDYPGSLEALPLWDSMDWLEFVLELEEELGIAIPDEVANEVSTTQRVTTKQMASVLYRYLKMKEMT